MFQKAVSFYPLRISIVSQRIVTPPRLDTAVQEIGPTLYSTKRPFLAFSYRKLQQSEVRTVQVYRELYATI